MNDLPDYALHSRFLRGLAGAAERPAIRVGAETVSFAEAHELALRWAGALLAGSAEPLRAVGVLANTGIEGFIGNLAALYAGCTVVPLHPDFPALRTRRMIQAAGVSAVLADEQGLSALTAAELDIPVLVPRRSGEGDGRQRSISSVPRHTLDAPLMVKPSDVAYILFTSGSTGRPKGVQITHGNMASYFRSVDERYDFCAEDVFSQTFGLNFDCAMFNLFCAWNAGASVHAVPAQAYRDLPSFLAERRMSVWFSTPVSISLVRRMGGLAPDALPTLRWSFFAGEALQCQDAADWQAAASGSAVENLYGPTELTLTITSHRWLPEVSAGLGVNGLVPIGAVHEDHDHVLLDEDEKIATTEGELCVTGPQLTPGYLDPADNEPRFLEHDGRTWYRTGDRVRALAGNELLYLGRLDSQVQVQGWRVELAEVDQAVRGCTGVDDAVTVTRPADSGVELMVFYTGAPAPVTVLAQQLRRILPHGLIPRHYQHVEEFPLNANRKVDRGQLAREAAGTARES
ncbi:AMP-binding protein [Streptomyces sp. NPDC048484]|uniref:AMP-binding protein n=1 Tax=Streptomyces sp. NPDC048484 TaxID=3155146 RepID=UPI003437F6A4